MRRLVWASLGTIAYTYVLFPLLLFARARLRPRPVAMRPVQPVVSVIIAAYNEEASIGRKLESVLASDYPREFLEVIVASDGSTDATGAIVTQHAARGVTLLDLPRRGKAAALNAAIAAASGEVLVFTDANSMLPPDAVAELVRPFGDPEVGGVAGDQRYLEGESDHGSAGERRYWDLDRMLKEAGSRAGNVISATGALYAVRRSLVDRVPEGVTDDFAISTGVIARGSRLVFAPKAIALEPPAASASAEWSRKVRVITRGLRAVILRRELLDPRRHGFYAIQLASHKVLRRLMFAPLLLLAVAAPLSWRHGPLYRLLALGQAAVYGAGAAGLAMSAAGRRTPRLFALPSFFILANAASLVAVVNVLTGRTYNRWQPQRLGTGADAEPAATLDDPATIAALAGRLRHLVATDERPDASIVIPVNARADLDNVLKLLTDLGSYAGQWRFDIVLVLNNYDDDEAPPGALELRSLGVTVLEMPSVPRPLGQVVPLSARIPGIAVAKSDWTILFDADCRVPNATKLLDWYVERGARGDACAYTKVGYTDLRPGLSIQGRMWAHHGSRWVKRTILRIPTTRGSNYAVDRPRFTALHRNGFIADELNVGPAIRASGGRVTYSGDPALIVLTSGRMFQGGWRKLWRYLRYRLAYNLRVLPVRPGVASRTRRELDRPDRFDYATGPKAPSS